MGTETEQAVERLEQIIQDRKADAGHQDRVESDWRTQSVGSVEEIAREARIRDSKSSTANTSAEGTGRR